MNIAVRLKLEGFLSVFVDSLWTNFKGMCPGCTLDPEAILFAMRILFVIAVIVYILPSA